MAMTESEARSKIKHRITVINEIAGCRFDSKSVEDLEIALQALKEIREYRELGTVEELQALKEKNVIVTQGDIDTFKAYIDDCMDDVAFNNTDWNHSLAIALKCMELHKINERRCD